MKLLVIPPIHVARVWDNGAHKLAEACKWASREITPDQLKMMLMRGERQLVALDVDGEFKAWAAIQFQTLPNIRVLYVYAIYASGNTGPDAFKLLADYARAEGCASIRGACSEQVLRIWERKFQAKRLYTICEIDV